MNGAEGTPLIQLIGAGAFGAVIGWYIYYVNRYRTGDVKVSDITAIIGAIGGGAILAIFEAGTDLFGAYAIGLAGGFFAYFTTLLVMVLKSNGVFKVTWFLDGRRIKPADNEEIQPGRPPMK